MTRLVTIFLVALFVGQGAAQGAVHNAVPDTCNRTCLKVLVDSYLAALVAHDPSRVPLAPDVKFV